AMHLRGAAFDTYDGRSWSRSPIQQELPTRDGGILWLRRAPDASRDRVWHVDLEPIDPPVLFAPLSAVALQVRQRGDPVLNPRLEIRSEPEGAFRYTGSDERGVRYDIYIGSEPEVAAEPLSRADEERYTSLPRNISDRVRKFAQHIVNETSTPFEKAHAIESFLRRNFTYDLDSPAGRSQDPLDDFLFSSKKGHCEFYSTAMVVLLRELKVPARNVTGFIGGSYNRFGRYYAVRQGDAHSWVEAYLPERGWQTFDPTPPADAAPRSELSGMLAFLRDVIEATGQRWDRYVVGYDLRQQVYLFESISRYSSLHVSPGFVRTRLLQISAGAIVLTGVIYAVWRRKRARGKGPPPVLDNRTRERMLATALYELLESAMNAQGIARGASTPPLRHAQLLLRLGHPLAEEVLQLTQLYLDARFGGVSITDDAKRTFEVRVKKVRAVRAIAAAPAA
ncbi:MAG TPA: transglutaminase domain-containing protein, partial [Polyangiaceae bacterium]